MLDCRRDPMYYQIIYKGIRTMVTQQKLITDCRGKTHRYFHVSSRITVVPKDDRILIDPVTGTVIGMLPPYIVEKGKTHNVGRNKIKAELRALEVINRRNFVARRAAQKLSLLH
jgi:predicted PhzF superfamily epimerase YddE/YHI9